jgi:uncharacterized protein
MSEAMIREGVITTANEDGSAHVTPMGFVREDGAVTVSPFVPSTTLDNLRRQPQAVMNLTDDVRVIAGCLTGRRDWPVCRASKVDGWRLQHCLAHLEIAVIEHTEDRERPAFRCRVVHAETHRPFSGFNRAQAAVVEASILVSRLDWLPSEKVAAEMAYLTIAIEKTAGDRERLAWQWLVDAIAEHPKHRADPENLR